MRIHEPLSFTIVGTILAGTPVVRAEIEGQINDWDNGGPGASYFVDAEVENTSDSDCNSYTEMSVAASAYVDDDLEDFEFSTGPVVCDETNAVPLFPSLSGQFSQSPPAIPHCIIARIAKWVGTSSTVVPIEDMWCEY